MTNPKANRKDRGIAAIFLFKLLSNRQKPPKPEYSFLAVSPKLQTEFAS